MILEFTLEELIAYMEVDTDHSFGPEHHLYKPTDGYVLMLENGDFWSGNIERVSYVDGFSHFLVASGKNDNVYKLGDKVPVRVMVDATMRSHTHIAKVADTRGW